MELKKNPKADVRRNSSLYFAVGLLLMLLVTNFAINYKTYEKEKIDIGELNLEDEFEEEVPITELLQTPPPPPPPPPAPEVIEVVEDEEEIVETVIESTESNQETEIVEIDDIQIEAPPEEVAEVPFAVIENVPEYPGCERGTNAQKRDCMSEKISQFVQRKFDTDLASELGLSGIQKIIVFFKIDQKGDVVGVQARAPHPKLEEEAKKVVGQLPKMKPGKQRGKAVIVPYSLPIAFKIED